jgi:uncharacterized protein YjbI with pentapeptide repeats
VVQRTGSGQTFADRSAADLRGANLAGADIGTAFDILIRPGAADLLEEVTQQHPEDSTAREGVGSRESGAALTLADLRGADLINAKPEGDDWTEAALGGAKGVTAAFAAPTADFIVIGPIGSVTASRVFLYRTCTE